MKKKGNRLAIFIFFSIFVLFQFLIFNSADAQTMEEYCQVPAFVGSPIQPNILLTIDVSGSMSWSAYSNEYNADTTYEGYFIPDKRYKKVGGVWTETSDSLNCYRWKGLQGTCSGNYLNWYYMARIDLVRWAITGGTPASCKGSKTFNNDYCDPELWNEPGNSATGKIGTVCNDSLDVDGDGTADGGCILRTYYGVEVKVPWDRINDALAFQFKNLSFRPRIGVMFYSGTGIRSEKVYIGDFTSANSTQDQFPYMNLITYINSAEPSGATPTAPALWDSLNYFAQNEPVYGGFKPQSGSGDHWKNPMYVCEQGGTNCEYIPCAKNFVILLSDGQWNVGGNPVNYTCSIDTGYENSSADPVVPAYKMHMGFTNSATGESTSISAVYTIGLFLGGTGEQSLKNVAMYGSFDTTGKKWPDGLSDYPKGTCVMDDCGDGKGSACTDLPSSSSDWDEDSDGVPDTFQNAQNATEIKDAILNAVLDILKRASSGTAVSVLASGEGQGANMLQAVFYPKKTYGTDVQTEVDWTGMMQNLWYYIDPSSVYSTIREDTDTNKELDLKNDNIVNIYFDSDQSKTLAARCKDTDGDGDCDDTLTAIDFEDLKNLWEAGIELFKLTPANRTIYTNIDDDSTLDAFTTANDTSLMSLLNVSTKNEADMIISYVRGEDIGSCSTTTTTQCTSDSDCPSGETCVYFRRRTVTLTINGTPTTNTWKLGDIVHSTPRVQSWIKLNDYDKRYDDNSYERFIKDQKSDGTAKATKLYTDRGMVYVGANDGMLHAFKLGKLEIVRDFSTPTLKAKLTGTDIGKEQWAFIPKNALPYLKYLLDTDYCHLYYVDGSPYLVDASIGTTGCTEANYWDCPKTTDTWRTILIGSMRLGGACRDISSTCTDCVKTPMSNVGYSSYFALDITDQDNPKLLWEFTDDTMGFSTTGPVVLRIAAKNSNGSADNTKNGRWFVVFTSGPTGPIDSTTHEFLGKSDQNLKIFILDLKDGSLVREIDTGITEAFGGSVFNTTIDLDEDYQDDVLYLSYVNKSGTEWTGGGIIRLVTRNKDTTTGIVKNSLDPADWSWSKVIDLGEPVTTSISFLRNYGKGELWLFFGSGRFFYKNDDIEGRRKIFGIKEPCYSKGEKNMTYNCTTTVSTSDLDDATSSASSSVSKGWYIKLDCANSDTSPDCVTLSPTNYGAERVVTNPLASPLGVVFFTTFSPTSDVCGFGGNTYLWAVDYSTGGTPSIAALKGKALLQLSTGEIKEVDLPSAFTERKARRTVGFSGVPPQGAGLSILLDAEPIRRYLFIKEK